MAFLGTARDAPSSSRRPAGQPAGGKGLAAERHFCGKADRPWEAHQESPQRISDYVVSSPDLKVLWLKLSAEDSVPLLWPKEPWQWSTLINISVPLNGTWNMNYLMCLIEKISVCVVQLSISSTQPGWAPCGEAGALPHVCSCLCCLMFL